MLTSHQSCTETCCSIRMSRMLLQAPSLAGVAAPAPLWLPIRAVCALWGTYLQVEGFGGWQGLTAQPWLVSALGLCSSSPSQLCPAALGTHPVLGARPVVPGMSWAGGDRWCPRSCLLMGFELNLYVLVLLSCTNITGVAPVCCPQNPSSSCQLSPAVSNACSCILR